MADHGELVLEMWRQRPVYAIPARRTWQADGTSPRWVLTVIALAASMIMVAGPLHAPWHALGVRTYELLDHLRTRFLAPIDGARRALDQAGQAGRATG